MTRRDPFFGPFIEGGARCGDEFLGRHERGGCRGFLFIYWRYGVSSRCRGCRVSKGFGHSIDTDRHDARCVSYWLPLEPEGTTGLGEVGWGDSQLFIGAFVVLAR